ncbi:3e390b3b-aa50-429f-9cfd-881758ab1caf [Thermothielavioides terrestris]|uniref:3e390b3b-aa50-429f-9cfd-881758ab1caf n=1 Tax=Thermothielavioides terrestris TaxID=2587410 RepID=A0A446BKH7_9PEZI|nr:3e390b3b-aa50-429f-9cfd-881758ab1caf [Thermothielavioides terrestris]
MNAFVQRSRPWEDRTLLPLEGEERPENREGFVWVEDFMFHEAGFMLSALESFGRTQPDPDTWNCEWFSNAWKDRCGSTRWSPLPLISPTDYRLWLLHSVIEPADSSTPHVQVLLQSKVPLQDDTLTTGEMIIATAVLATRRYFEGKTYNHHRYVPATIFSACCRQLRLLQVWHDKEQPLAVHVRQSRIFDFTEGYEANYKDWITFVCWLMGSPICQPVSSQVAPTVCSPGGGATTGASEGDKSESARSGSSHSDSHQPDDSPGDSLHRSETAGASQC